MEGCGRGFSVGIESEVHRGCQETEREVQLVNGYKLKARREMSFPP